MCFDIENELNKLNKYGSKLGLDRIRELLNRLGNPQKQLRIVHIGGTNGKGSVVCYLESIAIASKIKCGAYTSPALSKFNENTRINDRWIEKTQAQKIYNKIIIECEKMVADGFEHPTRFEVETVIAFCHFAIEKCELVFLEVGLGGELDATNIIENPILTLLTSISIDHIAEFGDSLQSVTKAECGIIKEGVPVIIAPNQEKEVLEVIKQITKEKNSPLTIANLYEKPLKNKAVYATINAGLAQATAEILRFNKKNIAKGITNAIWYDRYEIVSYNHRTTAKKTTVILDGAHNPSAIQALCDTLKKEYPNRKIIFVVSINRDKDANKMLEIMSSVAHKIVCLSNESNSRLLSTRELVDIAKKHHNFIETIVNPLFDFKAVIEKSTNRDVIVATGSLSHLYTIDNAYYSYIFWHKNWDIISELTNNGQNKKILKLLLNNILFCHAMQAIEFLEKDREFCKHDLEHLLKVAQLALKEANGKIDVEVIIATALLHDLGRAEDQLLIPILFTSKQPHNILSAKFAEDILPNYGFNIDEITQICSAIETHNDDSVSNDTGLNGIIYRADKASRDCNNCKAKHKCKNYL